MPRALRAITDYARKLRTELLRQGPVLVALLALGMIIALSGCGATDGSQADLAQSTADTGALGEALCAGDEDQGISRPSHWTTASHCKGVDPDYGKLFDDQVVHRFDITVAPSVYEQTQQDLAQLLGGGAGPQVASSADPIWVPVTIAFDGKRWDRVGMRYKGNSSLHSAWREGIKKLAFRLSFDKFEEDSPELANQRFFGFKKMTFSNGFKDDSLLRDRLAAEIFRAGGVPAARGAFARVYVDCGGGPVYFGLYTMIEDPSDELIGTQFDDGSGNLYKPEGTGAAWGSFVETDFEKKTNEKNADWSDVEAAIRALHAAERTTAPAAWREALEQVFDAQGFLRHLALNQAMENWDFYGFMAHNYYLYADPSDGNVLKWIPWDLNEAMLHVERGPSAAASSVMLEGVGEDRPLIRYLLDDEVYLGVYRAELKAAVEGAFAKDVVVAKLKAYHALIAPFVSGPDGERAPYTFLRDAAAFDESVDALVRHIASRHEEVAKAVD